MGANHRDLDRERLTELAKKAQSGDAHAFREIIVMLQSDLQRHAFFLSHNSQMAEDLCQEAFLKAYEALSTLREPQNFKAWIYRILKNLFLNHTQLSSTQSEVLTEDITQVVESEVTQVQMEQALSIRKLLKTLSPLDRSLMLMVHLEGFTYREAAEVAEITEDAVRLRLHRARVELCKKMEGQ